MKKFILYSTDKNSTRTVTRVGIDDQHAQRLLSDYAFAESEGGRQTFETENNVFVLECVEVQMQNLPKIVPLKHVPAFSNPFHHDLYNMGCEVSGHWTVMYNRHVAQASVQDVNDDSQEPDYMIFCNTRTGQRFRLDFDTTRARGENTDAFEARWLPITAFELLSQYRCEVRLCHDKRFYRFSGKREAIFDLQTSRVLYPRATIFTPDAELTWPEVETLEDVRHFLAMCEAHYVE